MSIPGLQGTSQAYPSASIGGLTGQNTLSRSGSLSFDQFQKRQTEPSLNFSLFEKLKTAVFHPFQLARFLLKPAPPGSGENLLARLKMYNTVKNALDRKTGKQFKTLLKQGVLNDSDTDNRHTTLYQLYGMLTTRRGKGYDAKTLVKETVEILHRPYLITQKFKPLSDTAAQQILQVRNNPGLNRRQEAPPAKPLRWNDLNVDTSATCVSSSVMYYMAQKKPGELARHLNELTSPMNAFFEKARLDEISPDDPRQAFEILRQHGLRYYLSGPGEVTIRVDNPTAGVLRAVDSQGVPIGHQYRNATQAAYQSALTYLATRSYDPATDMRDSEVPGEGSKGLTEPEKTLMETIIKDNGGVQSVTYQTVAGKANPSPEEQGNSYLYGYTRSFEQTAADLTDALKMGEFVVIGITDTDPSGAIAGGHEITITSAFVDKKDGELKFVVADSDDDVPTLVVRSARELIPRIHHAGLPLQLSRRINQQINQNQGSYMVPDPADANKYTLLSYQQGPMPAEQPPAELSQTQAPSASQQAIHTPATQTPVHNQAQNTEWQWVPTYYPIYPGQASPAAASGFNVSQPSPQAQDPASGPSVQNFPSGNYQVQQVSIPLGFNPTASNSFRQAQA